MAPKERAGGRQKGVHGAPKGCSRGRQNGLEVYKCNNNGFNVHLASEDVIGDPKGCRQRDVQGSPKGCSLFKGPGGAEMVFKGAERVFKGSKNGCSRERQKSSRGLKNDDQWGAK